MLATTGTAERGTARRLEARPLTVLDTDDAGSVWFLVSRLGRLGRRAATAGTPALFTGSDDERRVVVLGVRDGCSWSTTATASSSCWNPLAGAWFEGADDPDLVAIRVQAHELSWWDSPSSGLVRLCKIAKAALGGDADDVGDHGTETISTRPRLARADGQVAGVEPGVAVGPVDLLVAHAHVDGLAHR